MLPYGDTFLIIGGNDNLSFLDLTDEILQFNVEDESWTVREERLNRSRSEHYATWVDETRYNNFCQ